MECTSYKDDKLRISIRDFGPGVAPDQMRKIFKLFYPGLTITDAWQYALMLKHPKTPPKLASR